MSEDLAGFLARVRATVDAELDARLPSPETAPRRLHEAMRYAVFSGGKRVRPALVVLGGEAFGAADPVLNAAAAAVEMIHAYSLVHDDLPALDDDDLRRGRPTVHKRFDEATAVLTGDALLTTALALLAALPPGGRAVALVGSAIGTGGMIGGQADDLEAERAWPADPAAALDSIHRRKTGALITASLRLGGLIAGADPDGDALLAALGERVGLLFQIGDDLLDAEGRSDVLGKTAGRDARRRKLTYPALHGAATSRGRLHDLVEESRELCVRLPRRGALALDLVARLGRRAG
jgi:geranylgeranyl pyrophosphate synthase